MWIKLELDGIDFHFRIQAGTEEWCRVDMTLQSGGWLDYHIVSNELIMSGEAEELRDKIDDLLNDRLDQPYLLDCIEPDFAFHLNPKTDLRNDPRILYVSPGCEVVDIYMDFSVTFWGDGGPSENRLLLRFNREALEKLLCYLQLATGAVERDDSRVRKLLDKGSIYGD